MKYILLLISCLTLLNCSKDNKSVGPGVPPGGAHGSFEISGSVDSKNNLTADACWSTAVKSLDERIQTGLSFSSIFSNKEFDDQIMSTSESTETITSVDRIGNSYISKTILKSAGVNGWISQKTQFTFKDTAATSEVELIEVSPSLQNLVAKNAAESAAGNRTYTVCYVNSDDATKYKSEEKIEDGTFTLASGKKISAQRLTLVTTGPVVCIKQKDAGDGKPPEEISRTEMGNGTTTYITVDSKDVPSIDGYCNFKVRTIYRLNEVITDAKKVLTMDSEELTGGHF